MGGLTLAELLQKRSAAGAEHARKKSVIMIWLRGAMSHIDSLDTKPDASVEIRGEVQPIATNLPGAQVCEYLPKTAQTIDKLAILRGIKSIDIGNHATHFILTGFRERGKRLVFGLVVSHPRPQSDGTPPDVSLMDKPPGLYDNEGPTYIARRIVRSFPRPKVWPI